MSGVRGCPDAPGVRVLVLGEGEVPRGVDSDEYL